MSDTTTPDKVSMEFAGPVPGILGMASGYHAVFWVQAAGGAGFTRPSQEERDYYAEAGKPVPEWQCEYFEFDGVTWAEAALTVELWSGPAKLRSLFLPSRNGRTEANVRAELPDLDRFLTKQNLTAGKIEPDFHAALLRAAESAGVITRGVDSGAPRARAAVHVGDGADSWWRRTLRRAWPKRRAA